MNDKDEIKELFQKELGNYQAKVNPNLWNGIQAGLGSAGAATGAAASMGLLGKIVIGVSITAALAVGTVLLVNKEEKTPKTENSTPVLITEDSLEKVDIQKQESKKEIKLDLSTNENSTIEDNTVLEYSQKQEIEDKKENNVTVNKVDDQSLIEQKNNEINAQENSITPPKVKSNDKVELIKDDMSKSKSAPLLVPNTSKNEFVSELSKVRAIIIKQENQFVSFKAEGIPNDAYVVWNFGDGTLDRNIEPEHFYAEAGTYDVKCTVKTDNEEVVKNIQIDIKVSGEISDLPNVFTPNGDGNNDEFFVNCENIKNFQLTIIDQQQNTIFSTNDVDFRWTGIDKNGQPAKDGTYYYIIVAEDESGNVINKYQQLRLQR